MGQSALLVEPHSEGLGKEPLLSPSFAKLQELTRHGYLPDATPHGDGILLRHPSAPDLVLRADGSIELPVAQGTKGKPARAARIRRQISWRRTFLFLIVLMVGICVGWLMTAILFT